jgi:ectoine hydroxylase-related dioxygenase (phytanoyl-CoA dioxygenase family)
MLLKNSIRNDFVREGFVGPLEVLTREHAQAALEQVQEELGRPNANRFKLHLILSCLSEIAHQPTLVAAVQRALNSQNILLWSSDINLKPPQSTGFFAPHQDATYAGLTPASKCLTAWVALSDPVGEQEGCLSFYPKSHTMGQLPHDTKTSDENLLSLGQYIAPKYVETLETPRCIPLRGGQATLHSFDCVHFSGPNQSPTLPRVGFALRYMAADVVQSKPTKELVTVIAISGAQVGDFDLEPKLPLRPSAEDIEKGRQAREEAMRREEANYFADSSPS